MVDVQTSGRRISCFDKICVVELLVSLYRHLPHYRMLLAPVRLLPSCCGWLGAHFKRRVLRPPNTMKIISHITNSELGLWR